MLQDILGQPYALAVLENALRDGRIAGSYLFVGPDGVGKRTMARAFAKRLCGAASDDDPVARAIETGAFPDVREVSPPPSGIISVKSIWPRGSDKDHPADLALLRYVDSQPMAGPKQVYLIYDAEGLGRGGADAGNSLLKTLEEPPPYAHFILTAASVGGVLPTIVSRCQVVHFGLLPTDAIEATLRARFAVPPASAHFLAAYCEGRLGRAVMLSRSPALLAGREAVLDVALDLASAPPVKGLRLGEDFRKAASKLKASGGEEDSGDDKEKGAREPVVRGLDLLASAYRDLLAASVGGPNAQIVNLDRAEALRAAAERHPPAQWEAALELVLAVRRAVERNANIALAVDVLCARLTSLDESVS